MNNGNPSVLVVEDDREINQLVGAYAQLLGFEYRSALDGRTALNEAHRQPPSAVILDLMLPDVDGFEVCRRFRKDELMRRVPIIILSALSSDKDKQMGRECGANAYLTKPFNPDQLIEKLNEYVKTQRPN
jgi:DNA-binding response OmpR family regulator